jgi:hypothetical protein
MRVCGLASWFSLGLPTNSDSASRPSDRASNTSDVRALENTAGSSRIAAAYYDSKQVWLQLTFGSAFSGNLGLYAVDWDSQGGGRRSPLAAKPRACRLI